MLCNGFGCCLGFSAAAGAAGVVVDFSVPCWSALSTAATEGCCCWLSPAAAAVSELDLEGALVEAGLLWCCAGSASWFAVFQPVSYSASCQASFFQLLQLM